MSVLFPTTKGLTFLGGMKVYNQVNPQIWEMGLGPCE